MKKIANVKHVISATIDSDSIRNVCIGTGRVKLRLGQNEDIDVVKLQFLKAGFGVQEHTANTSLKAAFNEDGVKSPQKASVDPKMSKINNLQSKNPEAFGNTSKH